MIRGLRLPFPHRRLEIAESTRLGGGVAVALEGPGADDLVVAVLDPAYGASVAEKTCQASSALAVWLSTM